MYDRIEARNTFSHFGVVMRTYFPNLESINQQTHQLAGVQCRHCRRTEQLISHGYIYRKRHGGEPEPIGKRVFCSNRHARVGCGRTIRLYLDSTIAHLHATAAQLSAFVLALVAGIAVAPAYFSATGAPARNAWRWLGKMRAQLSSWRSLVHQPPLPAPALPPAPRRYRHQVALRTTLAALDTGHPAPSICCAFQRLWQRSLL